MKTTALRPGIALVVTLLMLTVITFLAVAFLILTRSERATATVSLDEESASMMSHAALARAESEILARMQTNGDVLNYDFMVSTNFISPTYSAGGGYNPLNVNYDLVPANNPVEQAQNIANLYYDPRAPVFVQTNLSSPNLDFRFWYDMNRNGRFETNGYQPEVDNTGHTNGNYDNLVGEPEWIGVLEYPQSPHSATNRFIGRYAYIVLPAGRTADLNFIHNYSKSLLSPPAPMPAAGSLNEDKYTRDQGVGSYELNLAALLFDANALTFGQYGYTGPGAGPNQGDAFDAAYSFMRYRYAGNSLAPYFYGNPYPTTLQQTLPLNTSILTPSYYTNSGIDEFGADVNLPYTDPWPGGYAANAYGDILTELYDPSKTSTNFTYELLATSTNLDTYDRYTLERLLSSVGTGSGPELQTYVYDDGVSIVPGTMPKRLRNKVNINYDNSYEITNGLNTSPPVLSPWTNALAFFTNAAESLVRSQEYPFVVTNLIVNGQIFPVTNWNHFGLTNMIVYSATNPTIRYTENLHRMLQLAANIYDAARTNAVPIPISPGTAVPPAPSVFRPLFRTDGTNVYIIGYTNMSGGPGTLVQIEKGFIELTNAINAPANILLNANIWGIPWVVGVVKGLPEFDRYTSDNSWFVERKLLFQRHTSNNVVVPSSAPDFTNQYYCMSLTNISGMDAWNTYLISWAPPGGFSVFANNYVTLTLTNNSSYRPCGTNVTFANYAMTNFAGWQQFSGVLGYESNAMISFLHTNILTLPGDYFSESGLGFSLISQDLLTNAANVGTNLGQYAFLASDRQQRILPAYNWTLTVTNHLVYCLMNASNGEVYDFVNLGPFGTNIVLTNYLDPQSYAGTIGSIGLQGGNIGSPWDPTMLTSGMNQGVINQIAANLANTTFKSNIMGNSTNLELYFGPPNPPPATNALVSQTWIVNDPLVHYTLGDLTAPLGNNSDVLTHNNRYEPWPGRSPGTQTIGADMTFKDPMMTGSDEWDFPNHPFPNVGWLGRVHRGTPWQTIFLKADQDGLTPNPDWTNDWVSTMDTYPTGDYALLDLFTATPNDNAASGLVSINETNSPAWYAVLAGLAVPTNQSGYVTPIDPTTTNIDYIIAGLNAYRQLEPNQLYHRLGDILISPTLTIGSPLLATNADLLPDEAVEAIPQAALGLLRVGYPQFVIYGFGQSLKPKQIYFGANNFNLCTNYQITGEYVTRMVCHLVGLPDASNVKLEVDSYNILPGN